MRFMPKYHPMGELAPRDVVARAIVHELEVSRAKDPVVYLDLTHLDGEHVKKRFPRIYATCMQYNIDITTELIPIRPAAHYAMGGVRTDLEGRTTVAGLYAAGEAAATGVHGANRLASNSLLEGLVFGARAGKRMRDELQRSGESQTPLAGSIVERPGGAAWSKSIGEIQDLMWQDVGIVRDGTRAEAGDRTPGKASRGPHIRTPGAAQRHRIFRLSDCWSPVPRWPARRAAARTTAPTSLPTTTPSF